MFRRLLLFLSLACLASAQSPLLLIDPAPHFVATDTVTLTASSETFTIQLAANSNRTVVLEALVISCSGCTSSYTVTQAWNGATAATTTRSPMYALPGTTALPAAAVFTTSNVGTGACSPNCPLDTIPAGTTPQAYDLSKSHLDRLKSPAQNYSVTITGTGTFTIRYQWGEV